MLPATVRIAPSILAADFGHLSDQVKQVEDGGADQIHIDVMDGHFVPNITMGPVVVEAVRRATQLPLDVHLMVSEPENLFEAFARAGADALTFHIEAARDALNAIHQIRQLGKRAGISLRPKTPVSTIEPILTEVDIVLVMSVEPGFGGQGFLQDSLLRIAQVREMLVTRKLSADLSVDGGITTTTAPAVVKSGADVLVAGTSIFKNKVSISGSIEGLRSAAKVQ